MLSFPTLSVCLTLKTNFHILPQCESKKLHREAQEAIFDMKSELDIKKQNRDTMLALNGVIFMNRL